MLRAPTIESVAQMRPCRCDGDLAVTCKCHRVACRRTYKTSKCRAWHPTSDPLHMLCTDRTSTCHRVRASATTPPLLRRPLLSCAVREKAVREGWWTRWRSRRRPRAHRRAPRSRKVRPTHDPRPPTATLAQWRPSPPFDVIETCRSLSRAQICARHSP